MTKNEVLQIPKLKQEGMRNWQIAQKFGVSTSAINYWCTRLKKEGYDVPRFRSGGRKKIEL